MANLNVEVFGLKLKHPIILSSGCLTHTGAGMIAGLRGGASAAIGKTCGSKAKMGHPQPQIINKPSKAYMVNAQGIPNPGVEKFIEDIKKAIDAGLGPIFASALGEKPEDFAYVARGLEEAGAELIELNVSCVHPTHGVKYGFLSGDNPEQVYNTVKAVKQAVSIPVVPKISSHKILDVPILAKAAEEAGADGVTVANTLPALELNTDTLKPALGNPDGVGGLSGDAIKPIILRCVADTARVVKIPIMATGGCTTGADVAEMLALGASVVQVHTAAMYYGMKHFSKMVEELDAYLDTHNFKSVNEIIGYSLQFLPPKPLQMQDDH
ncbi:MAG TPA: tRNA-dihydrouridine synthase [Clostridia bacterium]|nr:tRNA-dihydrouridine synthase [Clostridia bacterium]